jgi:hypothetical protein
MPCRLHCITQDVDLIWPMAAKLIEAAMTKTNLSDFAIVADDVRAGHALLWIATNEKDLQAAAVTQVTKANGHKYCTIIACGGVDHKEWISLLDEVEDYARQMDCAAIRFFGRNGWSRLLPDYKIIGHITERKLA